MIALGKFLSFAGIFVGMYFLGISFARIPTRLSDRMLGNSIVVKTKFRDKLYNLAVKPLLEPVAALIPISYVQQMELEAELRQVDIALSAQKYYARAIILGVYTLPLSPLVLAVGLHPVFSYLMLVVSVLTSFYFMQVHIDRLKEKRREIERHLPSFVRSILYSINMDDEPERDTFIVQVDLIKIFSDYLKVAPRSIHYDISMLLTDMQTVGIETGLRRFNERLRLPVVSYLCDILIALSKGQPQREALAILSRDMDVTSREIIRAELLRRPSKMNWAFLPLAAMAVIAVIYVLLSDVVNSIGFFG